MASGARNHAGHQATVSRAGLGRPAGGRRTYGFNDDASAGGVECQSQEGSRLAAGPSVMAPRICGNRKAILRAEISGVTNSSQPSASSSEPPAVSGQPPLRFALEPGVDALDHLRVVIAKAFLGDVAEMRRQHEVVELAEGMIDRQRLDREHIDRGAGDLVL